MSSPSSLAEIDAARDGKKRELRLSGKDKSLDTRIASVGGAIPSSIGTLSLLTSLEIALLPGLTSLPDELGRLAALRDLSITENAALKALPATIGDLAELRTLITSKNALASLPDSVCRLAKLQTLNVSHNALERLPEGLGTLAELITLDVSSNKLASLPASTWQLQRLSTLDLSRNPFESLAAGVGALSQLKALSMRGCDRLKTLPAELSDCARLKDLAFEGCVAIEDKKLAKLLQATGGNAAKQVLQHLRGGKSKRQAKEEEHEQTEREATAAAVEGKPIVRIEAANSKSGRAIVVVTDDSVKKVRAHIVCCVLSGLDLEGTLDASAADTQGDDDQVDAATEGVQLERNSRFRRFISLQTELHDRDCGKRALATVGTHDLSRVAGDRLRYCAESPADIRFRPLKAAEDMSADEFVRRAAAADDPFGIGRHLHLLQGLKTYAVLRDDEGVVCFPPIVNSLRTRVDAGTRDVLVEVTSDKDLVTCRRVMDKLVTGLVTALGRNGAVPAATVRQVRVVDAADNLRVVYPSKQDLGGTELKVEWAR